MSVKKGHIAEQVKDCEKALLRCLLRPYMGKFVAEIPLPVGEKGISALDLSEIGIDVVEQDPVDMEKNRTIWATKLLASS